MMIDGDDMALGHAGGYCTKAFECVQAIGLGVLLLHT